MKPKMRVCLREREREIKLNKYATVSMNIWIRYEYGLYCVVYKIGRAHV